ncbi:MAG: hypothetical protein IJ789_05225 [Bacteroidales bacterium]|nr:hypothetical protein [Bacteroidales bacterium]
MNNNDNHRLKEVTFRNQFKKNIIFFTVVAVVAVLLRAIFTDISGKGLLVEIIIWLLTGLVLSVVFSAVEVWLNRRSNKEQNDA